MMYDVLAHYYDLLVKDDEASAAWVNWICTSSKPSSLLELACGSGEITLKLANCGYSVTALDLSQSMVDEAIQKDTEKQVNFLCQNMLDLSNLGLFDVICCLCDSFNYLLTQEEVETFFHEIYHHLNTNGLCFFDTHSLDRMEEFKEEFNETGEFEDCQYQWSIMSEEDRIYQDFAFYLPDGTIHQEHHLQKVYTPEFLESVISPYFDILKITTDFDLEGIQEGEKYFYVLRKKG